MDSHLIIHVATDTVDASILLLAQIATILASFSFAVSILFLFDYFKRHGWIYHKKKPVVSTTYVRPTMDEAILEHDKRVTKEVFGKTPKLYKKEKRMTKNTGSPF